MHARMSVPLWQQFDLTSAVPSVSFDLLGSSSRFGIMIGTSDNAFDSPVTPLGFFTVL